MTQYCGLTTLSTLPTVLSVQHRYYYCHYLRYIKKYSRFIIRTISCRRHVSPCASLSYKNFFTAVPYTNVWHTALKYSGLSGLFLIFLSGSKQKTVVQKTTDILSDLSIHMIDLHKIVTQTAEALGRQQ